MDNLLNKIARIILALLIPIVIIIWYINSDWYKARLGEKEFFKNYYNTKMK